MKLFWIGAMPKVQLVMDGQCQDVVTGEAVEVPEEHAPGMIESGNWTATAPETTQEP